MDARLNPKIAQRRQSPQATTAADLRTSDVSNCPFWRRIAESQNHKDRCPVASIMDEGYRARVCGATEGSCPLGFTVKIASLHQGKRRLTVAHDGRHLPPGFAALDPAHVIAGYFDQRATGRADGGVHFSVSLDAGGAVTVTRIPSQQASRLTSLRFTDLGWVLIGKGPLLANRKTTAASVRGADGGRVGTLHRA
jgi:hypothetical protein